MSEDTRNTPEPVSLHHMRDIYEHLSSEDKFDLLESILVAYANSPEAAVSVIDQFMFLVSTNRDIGMLAEGGDE